jgi:head-tail adaptor
MSGLNRRLILEERMRAEDGAGGFVGSWTALGVHWGAVRPATGRLVRGEDYARSLGRYRVRMRAVPMDSPSRPKPGQRFREGMRVLMIRAVQDSSDARFLSCTVDEEQAT